MKINNEQLKDIGLTQYPSPRQHLWGDWEDLEFNTRTNELFYHSCVDGELELCCRVTDFEHLKQAIYDGFPSLRNELNLDI